MAMLETWGDTLKDLANRLFGKKATKRSGLVPGQRGYIQATFDMVFDETKCRPQPRPPVSDKCQRWGQIQRAHKIARKGHRMKKRRRFEGSYAYKGQVSVT